MAVSENSISVAETILVKEDVEIKTCRGACSDDDACRIGHGLRSRCSLNGGLSFAKLSAKLGDMPEGVLLRSGC